MLRKYLSQLQIQLTIAFALTALVPLIIVGGYGLRTVSNTLKERAIQAETHHLNQLASTIRSFFQGTSTDAIFLARSAPLQMLLEAIASEEPAAIETARRRLAEEFIALARTRGIYFKIRYIDATGQEIVEIEANGGAFRISEGDQLQNESRDDYFINGMALQEGEIYATRLRLETQGGVIVTPHTPGIRYATPVFYNGERYGVVVTNVDAQPLFRLIQERSTRKVEESTPGAGQVLLVDEDGFYIWHPDERKRWGGPRDLDTGESLMRDFPDLATELLNGQAGAVVANGLVITHIPVSLDMPGQPTWTLLGITPEEEILAPVIGFRNVFLGLMGIALVLAFIIGGVLSRTITHPLVELARIASRISQGDLTQIITIDSGGEIGQLTQAFGHMTGELQGLVERIAAAAQRTSSAAEALSTMTEQLNTTAEQISTAVQQVAQGASTQANQVENVSRAIQHLAHATDQIAENATQTEQASQQATAKAMNLVQTMEALQRRSEDIENMAQTVKRFADQTNLLALNAAIEAARAGEHGKSFAVVADEVRRLARSSRQAVEEITTLNTQIHTEMQQIVAEVQGIADIVRQTATLASQTAEATNRQRQESDMVVRAANEMASLAEEQAASTEEMATAIEEQMVSTEELASAAQELSEMATELRGLVARFQLPSIAESSKDGEAQ